MDRAHALGEQGLAGRLAAQGALGDGRPVADGPERAHRRAGPPVAHQPPFFQQTPVKSISSIGSSMPCWAR